MSSSPRKETYTVAEAADLLGVSKTTVYEQLRQNTFPTPSVRVGARFVISKTPLDAWLQIGAYAPKPVRKTPPRISSRSMVTPPWGPEWGNGRPAA